MCNFTHQTEVGVLNAAVVIFTSQHKGTGKFGGEGEDRVCFSALLLRDVRACPECLGKVGCSFMQVFFFFFQIQFPSNVCMYLKT